MIKNLIMLSNRAVLSDVIQINVGIPSQSISHVLMFTTKYCINIQYYYIFIASEKSKRLTVECELVD